MENIAMSLNTLVAQIEQEIQSIYKQHPQTRKKTLKALREAKNVTNIQKLLFNSVADGVQHIIDDAKVQKERTTRFKTIPKFFPSPEPSSDLDCLIYSRIIMGYTMMPNGHHGRRFKAALRKFKSQERYVEFLQSFADTKLLGKENFHYLCQVGCPQATHEWMFVKDLPSALIADKSVIAESKKLLAQYGY